MYNIEQFVKAYMQAGVQVNENNFPVVAHEANKVRAVVEGYESGLSNSDTRTLVTWTMWKQLQEDSKQLAILAHSAIKALEYNSVHEFPTSIDCGNTTYLTSRTLGELERQFLFLNQEYQEYLMLKAKYGDM